MSECLAKTAGEQEKCQFYARATRETRCMYRTFERFCSCLEAQIDSKKSINEKNQEIIEEVKNSEVGKSY
jgi:hypothetical protein